MSAPDAYTAPEAASILRYFRNEYDLKAVTLLGGEPLLHPGIAEVCRDAKTMGLEVEICTNGHFAFCRQIQALAPYVDKLRISMEGLEATNDYIRQSGSFASAINTIKLADQLGVRLGVTMTVTSINLEEVVPLCPFTGCLRDTPGVGGCLNL